MSNDLFTVDVTAAMDAAVGPENGVRQAEFDALVADGRQVHDDLLLSRARGQVGFGDLYMLGREAMRARDAAESLASRFDNVAVLAQGAEADVASALIGSLSHPFHNLLPRAGRAGRPRVFLVDSMGPSRLGAFLESFAVEQTLMLLLSKSGSDVGSMVQYGIVRDMLKKRVGPGYQDHLVIVTDARSGTLREEALREGYLSFEVPANVPARFSALTPVGLLPAALAGGDVRGVLGGAHGAAELTAGEDLRTNPAYRFAAALHVLARERGRRHVFVTACQGTLSSTAVQLARLFEQCMGSGEGPTFTPINLTRDGAALAERSLTGRPDTAVVLLEIQKESRDRVFPDEVPGLPAVAGGQLSDVSGALVAATAGLLKEAGVPVLRLRLPALAANAVGALHMTAMLAAAFGAGLASREHAVSAGADRLRAALLERLGRPSAAAATAQPAD